MKKKFGTDDLIPDSDGIVLSSYLVLRIVSRNKDCGIKPVGDLDPEPFLTVLKIIHDYMCDITTHSSRQCNTTEAKYTHSHSLRSIFLVTPAETLTKTKFIRSCRRPVKDRMTPRATKTRRRLYRK